MVVYRPALPLLALLLLRPASADAQETLPNSLPAGLDFANVAHDCAEPILLPEPTGSHRIGTLTYHWSDSARTEPASDDPYDTHQVIAQLFYPAAPAPRAATAAYLPELDLVQQAMRSDTRSTPPEIADLLSVHGCVQTSSYPRSPVTGGAAPFPVLLVSPGGNMSRHWHTALAQELASHGYLVAVMSHAFSGLDVFPRGGLLMSSPRWDLPDDAPESEVSRMDRELADRLAADGSFTLDRLAELNAADPAGRFTGRLDLDRGGIIGHSRGGTTVGRACATDPRLDACVVYDNIGPDREVAAGLALPQLVVRAPWTEARTATLHGYLERNRTVAYDVVVDGAIHMSFTDLPFVEPARHVSAIDHAAAHRIIADVTLGFLDHHLRGGDPRGLRDAVAQHPQARLERFSSGN